MSGYKSYSFKKIFGSSPNKDLLIAFLNEIFKGRKTIVDLVYNKNEHQGENREETFSFQMMMLRIYAS